MNESEAPVDHGHRLASYDTSLVISGGVDCGRRRPNVYGKNWKHLFSTVHTAPNNTWYNDNVMRPRSYSRGLCNRKKLMLMLMLTIYNGYSVLHLLRFCLRSITTEIRLDEACAEVSFFLQLYLKLVHISFSRSLSFSRVRQWPCGVHCCVWQWCHQLSACVRCVQEQNCGLFRTLWHIFCHNIMQLCSLNLWPRGLRLADSLSCTTDHHLISFAWTSLSRVRDRQPKADDRQAR